MYDMLIREDYKDKFNKRKHKYYKIGVAFDGKNGGMNCQPYPGVAIVGPFIIRERTEKPAVEEGSGEPESAAGADAGDDFLE